MIDFFTADVRRSICRSRQQGQFRRCRGVGRAAQHLQLADRHPLLPVDAKDRDSVRAVLLGLLYEILKSME